jgi:exodeoxyribonuclease-5
MSSRTTGRVGVVGLGYVGLPLALAFSRAGYEVVGVDIDTERIETLRRGESYVTDVADEAVAIGLEEGFHPTTEYDALEDVDGVSICVPTPLRKTGQPDLSYVADATEQLADVLPDGCTVVLESTVYPGATEELVALERDLPRMGVAERGFAEAQIAQLKLRLDHIHEPKFVLNPQSDLRDADLLVLDEVSMVGADMAHDLLAFGKPILVLGDPGQLPPVTGTGVFTQAVPDVMLTEVHRQAADSPILQLATMAREGQDIPFGAYDDQVWKMSRFDVGPAQMLQGGQVICGTHAMRRRLNTAMKHAAGFDADYPTGAGEKIICLRNRHDLGLINGMFLTLTDVQAHPHNDRAFRASVQTNDGTPVAGTQDFWRGEYDDHVRFERDRHRREWMACRGLIQSSWGYAITCHKAQGDSFGTVIVFDEGFGHTAEERNQWLYTAITRAEHGLLVLS